MRTIVYGRGFIKFWLLLCTLSLGLGCSKTNNVYQPGAIVVTDAGQICTPDCNDKSCGSDGCGGSCGDCDCGEQCQMGACVFTACDGRQCGDNGCGGTCAPGCEATEACSSQFQCEEIVTRDSDTGLFWQTDLEKPLSTCMEGLRCTVQEARAYCEDIGEQNFGGYNDWRLPEIRELRSLTKTDRSDPAIALEGLRGGPVSAEFWSATRLANDMSGELSMFSWYLNGGDSSVLAASDEDSKYVRCVRGESNGIVPDFPMSNEFVRNSSQIIEHTRTGLQWQADRPSMPANCGMNGCSWAQAAQYCQSLELENTSEWRLPTSYELHDVVSYERREPAIDQNWFSELNPNPKFWTSDTRFGFSDNQAWLISFEYGGVLTDSKNKSYFVRCVRP